jgi:TolB protein
VSIVLTGCTGTAFDRGTEVGHTYRGVPTSDSTSKTTAAATAGPAQHVATWRHPTTRPLDPLFENGPGLLVDAKPVNMFGEMDGMPPVPGRPAGDAGYQQHTFTDEGSDSDVGVDPTGKWIIFASTRNAEHSDIYIQRVDGTAVTQLTSDAADDAYPCFSPDGKQVAFASTRAGAWQIYVMDTDGRNVVQVTSGAMQCIHPSFSPDGLRLAYSAIGSRSNQWEIWIADLRSSEKRMVGYGLFPRWSPDRTVDRIAYQKARQRGGRWFSLWTLDLIDGEGRRMTEVAASTNAAIVSPCWSPDGQRLSFATVMQPARAGSPPGKEPAPAHPRPQQDVWTINVDGSNRQRLTDGNGTNLSPFWASDNRIYFVSDRGGNECVWSVRTDPGRAMNVAGAAKAAPAPAIAPMAPPPPPAANAAVDQKEAEK